MKINITFPRFVLGLTIKLFFVEGGGREEKRV
jgi:hypothetical protein